MVFVAGLINRPVVTEASGVTTNLGRRRSDNNERQDRVRIENHTPRV